MKLSILALVARYNEEVVSVTPVANEYSKVHLTYSSDYVSTEDVIAWGVTVYGTRMYSAIHNQLTSLVEDRQFTLQLEAKDMPSIGRLHVQLEYRDLDWI